METMNPQRDWSSRLILTSKIMIGLVVLLGLFAFISLNPYLLAIFAFAQVFLALGVLLFVLAVIAHRRELVVDERTQNQERLYVVKGKRQPAARDHFGGRGELGDRDTLDADINRQAR